MCVCVCTWEGWPKNSSKRCLRRIKLNNSPYAQRISRYSMAGVRVTPLRTKYIGWWKESRYAAYTIPLCPSYISLYASARTAWHSSLITPLGRARLPRYFPWILHTRKITWADRGLSARPIEKERQRYGRRERERGAHIHTEWKNPRECSQPNARAAL